MHNDLLTEECAEALLMNHALKAINGIFKEKDMRDSYTKDYFAPAWWYEPDDECKPKRSLDDDYLYDNESLVLDGTFEEFGARRKVN